MSSKILVLNCGSSSIKFALLLAATGEQLIYGLIECLQSAATVMHWHSTDSSESVPLPAACHQQALQALLTRLRATDKLSDIAAIGHRVVHGGERFRTATLLDEATVAAIEALNPLAPLHNPANIAGIRAAAAVFGDVPQVAVFDTAFHAQMPAKAFRYALPETWYQENAVRRYGFHGTSHHFVALQAAKILAKDFHRLQCVTAHLGNGCSAAAIREGCSVDTTMGMTPLEGLVMGTRCGDIDSSIVSYIARTRHLSLAEVEEALNKSSGLLGLSTLSNDMRTLEKAAANGHQAAQLAIEVFCYRLVKAIAALCMALDHIDALIFTGGIGENSALIRAQVLQQLHHFRFKLAAEKNQQHGKSSQAYISTVDSPAVLVIPTQEEWMIAQHTAALLELPYS